MKIVECKTVEPIGLNDERIVHYVDSNEIIWYHPTEGRGGFTVSPSLFKAIRELNDSKEVSDIRCIIYAKTADSKVVTIDKQCNTIAKLKEENKVLNDKLTKQQDLLTKVHWDIKQGNECNVKLKEEFALMETHFEAMTIRLKEEKQSLSDEKQSLTLLNTSLKDINSKLEKEKKSDSFTPTNLLIENEKLRVINKQLNLQLEESEKNSKRITKQLKKNQSPMTMGLEHSVKEQVKLSMKLEAAKKQIERMNQRISCDECIKITQLQQDKHSLATAKIQMNNIISVLLDKVNQLAGTSYTIDDCKDNLHFKIAKIEANNPLVKVLEAELSNVKTDLEIKSNILEDEKATSQKRLKDLSMLRDEHNAMEGRYLNSIQGKSDIKTIDELKHTIKLNDKTIEELKAKVTNLTIKLNEDESNLCNWQKMALKAQHECKELIDKLNSPNPNHYNQEDIDNLKQQVKSRCTRIEQLETDNENLNNTIEQLGTEKENLNNTIEQILKER